MKLFRPQDLVQGVEELPGEENVLLVQSKSQSAVKHRVDLEAYAGFGSCTCEWFLEFGKATKVERTILAGHWPSESFACEHIRRARQYYFYQHIQFDIVEREVKSQHVKFQGKIVNPGEHVPF